MNSIKAAGNIFFKTGAYVEACRKYKKAVRYYHYLKDKLESTLPIDYSIQKTCELNAFNITVCLNIAASELELKSYTNAKNACDEVLLNDKHNAKAFYRRGQAHIGLKNYDEALVDLEQANRLLPNDKMIESRLHEAKEIWRNYEEVQRCVYKHLFT